MTHPPENPDGGRKLLEREPTEEMWSASIDAPTSRDVWYAMWDAAPAPKREDEAVRLAQHLLSRYPAPMPDGSIFGQAQTLARALLSNARGPETEEQ